MLALGDVPDDLAPIDELIRDRPTSWNDWELRWNTASRPVPVFIGDRRLKVVDQDLGAQSADDHYALEEEFDA